MSKKNTIALLRVVRQFLHGCEEQIQDGGSFSDLVPPSLRPAEAPLLIGILKDGCSGYWLKQALLQIQLPVKLETHEESLSVSEEITALESQPSLRRCHVFFCAGPVLLFATQHQLHTFSGSTLVSL